MSELVRQFVEGRSGARFVLVGLDGDASADGIAGDVALLPGSFNPLHEGHEQLAAAAAHLLGREVVFELSVVNVDKAPLTDAEVRQRLAQFGGRFRAVLTRAPRFVEKARLFGGCSFVVGWDTAARLLDVQYYGDEAALRAALAEMQALGCRFLVGGRMHDGVFKTLARAGLPLEFAAMFEEVSEARFRVDITSTELRSGDGGA